MKIVVFYEVQFFTVLNLTLNHYKGYYKNSVQYFAQLHCFKKGLGLLRSASNFRCQIIKTVKKFTQSISANFCLEKTIISLQATY